MEHAEKVELVGRVVAGDADALQRLLVHYHATLRGVAAAAIEPTLRRHVEPDDVLQQAYVSAFRALGDAAQTPSPKRERGPHVPSRECKRGAQHPSRDRQGATEFAAAQGPPDAPHFDGPGPFYKWLERIALNQLKDTQRALRRQKRDVAREVPDHADPRASYPDLVARLTAGDTTPSRVVAQDEATAAVMTCLARLGDDQREVVRLRILEDVPVAEIARRLGKSEVAVYALTRRGLKALQGLLGPITRYLTRM